MPEDFDVSQESFDADDRTRKKDSSVQVCHWSQLQGNPFLQALDVKMLRPKGVAIRREVKLGSKGEQIQKERTAVLYDKEFVVAKLHALFKPFILGRVPDAQVVELVRKALKYQPPSRKAVQE